MIDFVWSRDDDKTRWMWKRFKHNHTWIIKNKNSSQIWHMPSYTCMHNLTGDETYVNTCRDEERERKLTTTIESLLDVVSSSFFTTASSFWVRSNSLPCSLCKRQRIRLSAEGETEKLMYFGSLRQQRQKEIQAHVHLCVCGGNQTPPKIYMCAEDVQMCAFHV